MNASPAPAAPGWFINAPGAARICSWGTPFYGFPLIAEAMRTDLGWSKPTLYGAATLGMLLAGMAAYPVGAAIDRGHGVSSRAAPPCLPEFCLQRGLRSKG